MLAKTQQQHTNKQTKKPKKQKTKKTHSFSTQVTLLIWMSTFLLNSGLRYKIFMMIWVLYNDCRQHSSWLNLARFSLRMSMSLGLEPTIKRDCKFKWLHHLKNSAFWLGQRYLLQNLFRIHLNHYSCVTLKKLLHLSVALFSSSIEWINYKIYLRRLLKKLTYGKY